MGTRRFATTIILLEILGLICLGISPVQSSPSTPQIADLNGDGKADILTRLGTGDTIVTYFGNGSVGFSDSRSDTDSWSRADFAHHAPGFSQPSSNDVLVRDHADGSLRLYRWVDGKLVGGVAIGKNWHGMDAIILPGDFDGDGHPDVLARRAHDASLWLYSGNGAGGWKRTTQVGWGWHNMDMIFSAGDFDGDGNADVIARQAGGANLWLYPGNGKGGWKTPRKIGQNWHNMNHLFSVGDFDRDGAADIIARHNGTGDLLLYRGNGSGGWRGSRKIGHNWSALSLPGMWESTATTPLEPTPLPTPANPPKPVRTQLFVYGTLRNGQKPYNRMLAGNTTRELMTTASNYEMYSRVNGTYPFALVTSLTNNIIGEEMHIKDSVYWPVLQNLDAYENYDVNKPLSEQAYYRKQITLPTGTKAWIYETTPRMSTYLRTNGVKIPSGDWFKRSTKSPKTIPGPKKESLARHINPKDLGMTISEITKSTTCHGPFGTMESENGVFLSFNVALHPDSTLRDKHLDYLPAIPEAFSVINSSGQLYEGYSDAAKTCMTDRAPQAFVDVGMHATGTIILDVPTDADRLLIYQVTPDLIATYSLDGQELGDDTAARLVDRPDSATMGNDRSQSTGAQEGTGEE